MQHYVPLHPQVIREVEPLLDDRDDEPVFAYNSLEPWVRRQQIPLSRIKGNFVLGDLRKFAEQYGDIIQWDQSNRAYIMTHGVSGIDWKHYKHPLPELSLIHISEPTRLGMISYAVFCLKKKNKHIK